MPDRPLLALPKPIGISPPKGTGGSAKLHKPDKLQQIARNGPVFDRLRSLLNAKQEQVLELRKDPTALAPERVVVFETIGAVQNFVKAIGDIQGFEFLGEKALHRDADSDFANIDTRSSTKGQPRLDQSVEGRFYLALPDVRALRELLSLWERWRSGKELGIGFTPFRNAFEHLRELRVWGPKDRISNETIEYWRERTSQDPYLLVRTEVELWYHRERYLRNKASQSFSGLVREIGGAIVSEVAIPEICYHGALIDIPAGELEGLIERRNVSLVLADDVMFYLPQSILHTPFVDLSPEIPHLKSFTTKTSGAPVAGLLDGVPIQAHSLLQERLMLDDPDELEVNATVSMRRHGTAMASLIIHGDLNAGQTPLGRPLYILPILTPDGNGSETTAKNILLVDTIHRAVLRIKGNGSQPGAAPGVFLINLSIGDLRRPFSGLISPFARLLDYLSHKFGILFLVSSGNVTTQFKINGFENWTAYQAVSPVDRQRATLSALNDTKHERTILSPAESINSLTIGAQHFDNVLNRPTGNFSFVDPFDSDSLPNPSSGLGLGLNRTVKPDILMPGGREHLCMKSNDPWDITLRLQNSGALFGLRAASPDPSGQARLNTSALISGSSGATALATRAAHQIFDALTERGELLYEVDPKYYAVVIKALMVHRARWGDIAEILKEIYGPVDNKKNIEQKQNISRVLGFGVPNIAETIECSSNRATLVGVGELAPDHGHRFRIPLPQSLASVKEPRSLTVTLAWLSPVSPSMQTYRTIKFDAKPCEPDVSLGVKRNSSQPDFSTMDRGTVSHERYEGVNAVPFLDDGHISLDVWCKGDPEISQKVSYSVAVSIEAGTGIEVYEEIRQRLLVPIRSR